MRDGCGCTSWVTGLQLGSAHNMLWNVSATAQSWPRIRMEFILHRYETVIRYEKLSRYGTKPSLGTTSTRVRALVGGLSTGGSINRAIAQFSLWLFLQLLLVSTWSTFNATQYISQFILTDSTASGQNRCRVRIRANELLKLWPLKYVKMQLNTFLLWELQLVPCVEYGWLPFLWSWMN